MRALGMPGFTDAGVSSAPLERQRYRGNRGPQIACGLSVHMSRFGAREGSLESVLSSIMLLWQRAAQARAGTDPDESTVMDRDIAIYQTVDADADSDGPGSDRGRAQCSHTVKRRAFGEAGSLPAW